MSIYNISFSGENGVWPDLGEKYAQIKLCLSVWTTSELQNISKQICLWILIWEDIRGGGIFSIEGTL